MRRYFIFAATSAAIGVAFEFISIQPADAFVANQDAIGKAAVATNTVVEVKRSLNKGTPPGWHHGRKRGWHGSSRPPGQH